MMRAVVFLLAVIWTVPSLASAPDVSLRPVLRPAPSVTAIPAASDLSRLRPVARPARQPAQQSDPREQAARPVALRDVAPAGADALTAHVAQPQTDRDGRRGLIRSLRPAKRTLKVRREARAARKLRERGAVCGDLAIQGTQVGTVTGKIKGCVIQDAVKVKSVSGVALSQQSVMDCTTAKTLKKWVNNGLTPAVGNTGGGIARIRVAAHYACRTRNSKAGAKLSEHGKGRAIDMSAFTLKDGTEISVLKHWNSKAYGKILRKMHKTACGPFGTVLGPNANRYHLDHFHFDTARYRKGSYCR